MDWNMLADFSHNSQPRNSCCDMPITRRCLFTKYPIALTSDVPAKDRLSALLLLPMKSPFDKYNIPSLKVSWQPSVSTNIKMVKLNIFEMWQFSPNPPPPPKALRSPTQILLYVCEKFCKYFTHRKKLFLFTIFPPSFCNHLILNIAWKVHIYLPDRSHGRRHNQ